MNKRIRNKTKRPLYIGRPGSLMMSFWPGALIRKRNLLESGVVRHSKKRDTLKKEIAKIEYNIWDHVSFGSVHSEAVRRLGPIDESNFDSRLKELIAIHQVVKKEFYKDRMELIDEVLRKHEEWISERNSIQD